MEATTQSKVPLQSGEASTSRARVLEKHLSQAQRFPGDMASKPNSERQVEINQEKGW